jgi:hypothetical protein
MKLRSTRRSKQRGGDSTIGHIKVPSASMNFNFAKAVSTLPPTFGTLIPGGPDASTFSIALAPTYTPANLPAIMVTGYVYSSTAGYINVQRQFGVQTGTGAAQTMIDPAVKKMTFTNITKTNFPYTANDTPAGYSLYIIFQILN